VSRSNIAWFSAAVAAATALVFAWAQPSRAGRKAAAPYTLAVEAVYGQRVGSESVREWAERQIVSEIDEADCFAEVLRFGGVEQDEADLLLRVIVDDFEEKTEHETSLAQRDDPHAPPTEKLRLIASLEIWGDLELRTLPELYPVRARSLRLERGYRPALGEDPAYEVRRLLIEALGDEVRRWVCKGARKKLPGELERARAGNGPVR
jgi:hypothetical protein